MAEFSGLDFKEYLRNLGESSTGHNKLTLIKELIDNSLDASATKVLLLEEDDSIIIKDNGNGMSKQDLFRCIQFYSKNKMGKTGKYGIGGSTALVNLCKYKDTFGKLFIFTKNKCGETYGLDIEWAKYNSMSDFEKAINASIKANNHYTRLLDEFEHGTYIKFITDCNKIKDYFDEMNTWIDLSTSYYYYLKNNVDIHLFGEKLYPIGLDKYLLKESIDIDIYKNKKKYGYYAKIGRIIICYRYDKQSNRINICTLEEIDHWKLIGQLKLNIICPKTYTGSNPYKKHKSHSIKIPELEHYCNEYGVEEDSDILECQKGYLSPLYVSRNALDTTRVLGGLIVENTVELYKEITFDKKYDESLGLVQQNKSCIEWNNAPPHFKWFIEEVIEKFIQKKVVPEYKRLNKEYELESNKKKVLNDFIILHIKNAAATNQYNRYIFEDICMASSIIKKAYHKYYNKYKTIKLSASVTIQNWYTRWRDLYSSGKLKLNRFFHWAVIYHKQTYAVQYIQRLFRCYITKKRYKNTFAIKIQTLYRRHKNFKNYKKINKQVNLQLNSLTLSSISSIKQLDELIVKLRRTRKHISNLI